MPLVVPPHIKPPLPPYIGWITCWFKVGLGWLISAYSTHAMQLMGGGGEGETKSMHTIYGRGWGLVMGVKRVGTWDARCRFFN